MVFYTFLFLDLLPQPLLPPITITYALPLDSFASSPSILSTEKQTFTISFMGWPPSNLVVKAWHLQMTGLLGYKAHSCCQIIYKIAQNFFSSQNNKIGFHSHFLELPGVKNSNYKTKLMLVLQSYFK